MAALVSEAREFPGLDGWTGFFHKSGQTEDLSQRGRKHISDPQRVPNFTTAAESLRQFWFHLFPVSPRDSSSGHF
jgi:hypothetical protein